VKRRVLIRHLRAHDCELLREGSKHSVYFNPTRLKTSAVPRHREINDYLASKICRDLEVPSPGTDRL
jgi:mRNA interferase HicA